MHNNKNIQLRYYFIKLSQLSQIMKSGNVKYWKECGRTETLTAGGSVNWYNLFGE